MNVDPLAQRYIENFRAGLRHVPDAERNELVAEIESHIAEASAEGEPTSDVLARLGPADRLARAYRAELLLTEESRRTWLIRMFAVSALLLTASIPSLVIIPLLGGLGIGFVAGGVALTAWSLCPFDAHTLYSLPGALDRLARAGTGIGFLAAGGLALLTLYWYVRIVGSTVRRVARI
jgi:uncharacterized membrane protein